MTIRFLLVLLCTGGAASLSADKFGEKCLSKNGTGTCVLSTYIEDGYKTNSCTSPIDGTCTAQVQVGDRTAKCTAQKGNSCSARVRLSNAELIQEIMQAGVWPGIQK